MGGTVKTKEGSLTVSDLKEKVQELHRLFEQIIPFCKAGSNSQLTSRIGEAEAMFFRLEQLVELQETQIRALMQFEVNHKNMIEELKANIKKHPRFYRELEREKRG
jgi:hypothetical protein